MVIVKVEEVYPITRRVTPDGHEQVYITDDDLKGFTPPVKLDSLYEHLMGSTRYAEGNYLGDVEQWLNGAGKTD